MKKFFTSAIFIGSFGLYTLYHYFAASAAPAPVATAAPADQMPGTPVVVENPVSRPSAPTPTPSPTPAPAPKPKGAYVDGSYTGSVADAYYGNVEVKAVISGGKLANVVFLDYPSDRSTSRFINGHAMPILTSEAVSAQSANVDTVSGATDTSGAFRQSLAAALAQARA